MFYDSSALADYHIHPDFSFDAEGSLDDYCQSALKKGLREICFTTHYDTDPRLPDYHRQIRINGKKLPHSVDLFEKYVSAVLEIEEKYLHEGLHVKCGVEVGYYPGCEEEVKELINKYPLYYKLGAVHQIDGVDICNEKSMAECAASIGLDEFADRVFEALRQSAEGRLFDALAHLDMYKKYGLKYYGEEIRGIHRGRIEPVFEIMAQSGAGIEINTSALRKGHDEYYPGMDIVNIARSMGVPVVAVGSDAHRPEELAYDFETVSTIAYELMPYYGE